MTQSPRDLAAQTVKVHQDQEHLYKDLLGILDALDHACTHWEQAEQEHQEEIEQSGPLEEPLEPPPTNSLLEQFMRQLQGWVGRSRSVSTLTATEKREKLAEEGAGSMSEVLTSAREGAEMIRRSLLEILQQRQVVPLEAVGQPFDPSRMYALGRLEHEEVEENTVVTEVVRGYVWKNRVLRESQVMVAVKPLETEDLSN